MTATSWEKTPAEELCHEWEQRHTALSEGEMIHVGETRLISQRSQNTNTKHKHRFSSRTIKIMPHLTNYRPARRSIVPLETQRHNHVRDGSLQLLGTGVIATSCFARRGAMRSGWRLGGKRRLCCHRDSSCMYPHRSNKTNSPQYCTRNHTHK